MGRLTKEGFASDDYETPDYVMDYITRHWGPPELDLCATAEIAKAVLWFGSDRIDPREQNGLRAAWPGGRLGVVFCNPPYSGPGPWVQLMVNARERYRWGVMVLPSSVSVGWWRYLHMQAQDVVHIWPRVAFCNPLTHEPLKGPPGPVSLVVFDGLAPDAPIRYRYQELRP